MKQNQKNIYFLSDAHLGCRALKHRRMQERRLVNFLDQVKNKAQAIYLLGDMFDFWFEYKTVVPKGYTRFLGKLSELTDMGVEVHYFIGNHDLWMKDYLERECGVVMHRKSFTVELYDKVFYLAHGDGLGSSDRKFLFLRRMFHNPVCQRLFGSLHPRWGMSFGLNWAKHSRLKHEKGEPEFFGEEKEELIVFAKDYLKTHPETNYFIFGHRHIELDFSLAENSRLLILGDWVRLFTYAVYDGEKLYFDHFVEGDSKL